MKITMFKCDVKECKKIVEEKESHHITIGSLQYDLCNKCFPEFDKWIRETLENGQAIAEEIKATGIWGIPWTEIQPTDPVQPWKPNTGTNDYPSLKPTIWYGTAVDNATATTTTTTSASVNYEAFEAFFNKNK